MSIIRSYFSKNTCLIRDNLTNNSRNPVFELSYGNSQNSASTVISRFVLQVDLSNLQEKITNQEILTQNIISHKIKIKNVISESQDKIGGVFHDARRGSNARLVIYPLEQDFSEGTGFDYIYNETAYNQEFLNQTPANWYYADSGVFWAQPGIYSGSTAPNILDVQHLQDGSEDLELDVTQYINDVLISGATHYGLGISYSANTETFTSNNRYVITFFSRNTQTYYEPYLETTFNQVLNENRSNFYLDEVNNLYFSPNKDITSVNKVEIYDHEDQLYASYPSSALTLVQKNIWSLPLTISSSAYPDLVNFIDKWYYTANGKQYTVDNEFTLFKYDYFRTKSKQVAEYYFSFHGILYNDKLTRTSGTRKINISGKRLYQNSVDCDLVYDTLEYRIYNQQSDSIQLEVIPWTAVNRLQDDIYFDLDPSWLVPQFYYIELRTVVNGYNIVLNNRIKFQVVSEL